MATKWVTFLLMWTFFAPLALLGQTLSSGTIAGAVFDKSGALVPGAKITVKNLSTNFTWNTEATAAGEYRVLFLPAGKYEVTAESPGFARLVRTGITLSAAETVHVDLTLQVGQITQQVTVEANATTVSTESSDVGNTVSGTQTRELPLSTRQFIQMLTLEPGVNSNISGQPGFGSLSEAGISVNGMRQNQNNYMIDGVNNIDVYNGNNMVTPNLEALAEFRVSRAAFSAESGRSAGATINLITRSGSNDFHGSAFEFLRNDKLNSRNFFAYDQTDPTTGAVIPGTARPPNRYNNFGYTLGGPIKKDKLFFFWSQEYRRIIQSSGTYLTRVPTAAEKNGVFDQVLLNRTGKLTPTGAPCVTSAEGTSIVDPGCMDSNALLLLNTYWPAPNPSIKIANLNYSSSDPDFTKTREELFRVDYKPTAKLSIFGRYTQDNVSISSPYGLWGENAIPNEGSSFEFEPLQNAALNATYAFSPAVVNEIQYSYDHNLIRISEGATSARSRASGLNIPYLFPSNAQGNAEDRIPSIGLAQGNYAGISINWPFRNTYFYSKVTDNLSWMKGKHDFRFGVLVTRQGKGEDNVPDNQNGTFSFSGYATLDPNDPTDYPGNSLADMLMGLADSYSENPTKPHQILRYWDIEGYAQDSFKVTPNLTLNYGVRYSLFTAEHDNNGLLANFDPALYNAANAPVVDTWGDIVSPANYSYLNGIYAVSNAPIPSQYQSEVIKSPFGDKLYKVNKDNIAPRLGFAWDVFHDHRTSLRGGYGVYYDRWAPYVLWMKNTPPFNYPESVSRTLLSNPAAGSQNGETVVGISTIAPYFKVPNAQQWSVGIQHEVMKDTLLDVSYVGTKGTHLLRVRNLDQAFAPNLDVAQGNAGGYDLLPYQGLGYVGMFEPSAVSNYHSLQVAMNRRFSKGMSYQASYTWSRTLTDADNDGASPQNNYALSAERGLAGYDRTHVLTFNYVWEIPFGKSLKGLEGKLLDGWVLSGITTFQSGNPFSIAATTGFNGVAGSGGERADRVAGQSVVGPKSLTEYFNTAAFVDPAYLTWGNSGVNIVRGPGINNWDISLGKNTKINERFNLQYRAEFLNAWNHPSFSGVNNWLGGGPVFGQVTSARDPRLIQMGLKLQF